MSLYLNAKLAKKQFLFRGIYIAFFAPRSMRVLSHAVLRENYSYRIITPNQGP